MLRFLYTTDLHGDARAYECLPSLCETHGVTLIINGGDMLPKGRAMHAEQRSFLAEGMLRFAERCAARGISFYGLFGNDDLRAMHATWLSLVQATPMFTTSRNAGTNSRADTGSAAAHSSPTIRSG